MDEVQEKQRGAKRALTSKQEEFVKKAISRNAPAAFDIDEPEWNRAAIAKLIAKNCDGLVVSERTITDYRKRWDIKPPDKLVAKGGRPEHQIDTLIMDVISNLLELSGLSVSQLFLKLSQDNYMAPLIGKKASFHNRLNEAGLRAVERKPTTPKNLINHFCMRLRLLVFPIKGGADGEEKYAGLLCGYEVESGFITCWVFDIKVRSNAIAEPIYSGTPARDVRILKGSSGGVVYFPVKVVAEFVQDAIKRLGLPISKLEITQQFFPNTSNYDELQRAIEELLSTHKTKVEVRSTAAQNTKKGVMPFSKVRIEIAHGPVGILTPLSVTLAHLSEVIKARVNSHNDNVAYPAITKFKQEIRSVLTRESKPTWIKKPPSIEVRQLQEFCKIYPLYKAQAGPISCRPRQVDGCLVFSPHDCDLVSEMFHDEKSACDN